MNFRKCFGKAIISLRILGRILSLKHLKSPHHFFHVLGCGIKHDIRAMSLSHLSPPLLRISCMHTDEVDIYDR